MNIASKDLFMNPTEQGVLKEVAGIMDLPKGAYNIRLNGKSVGKSDSENVSIIFREDGAGMNIHIKPGAKETVHIPVVISASGVVETVYNDFFIGEGADVTIVAGCGIHNCGDETARHDGVHTFHLKAGARAKYIEKHYGAGDGAGERILNPVTEVYLDKDAHMEMDTVQIAGVDSTNRRTVAELKDGATLVVREKLMTHGSQYARTEFDVALNGVGCSTHVVSRSVAKGTSEQIFLAKMSGNVKCTGRSECDAIIMDNAKVVAIPEIIADHVDAEMVHEAAIGKIAGEQLIKLMTLGLSEEEAEAQIINGFLR